MIYKISTLLGYIASSLIILKILYSTQYRWVALLITSIIFYCLLVQNYIWVLLLFSLIIYTGGKCIYRKEILSKTRYRTILVLLLTPLLLFKLLPVLFENNTSVILNSNPFQIKNIHYFVGLSFFTFNGISYIVDIKRGYLKPEKNYGLLLLYLSYFPHILSGPLHRAKYLIPQFKNNICISDQNFSMGFRLVLWGIFKKFVLAQNLKIIVDSIIDHPEKYHGSYVLFAGFIFFLQIYCDFSSYIDIGQGISQLFGIKLKSNFVDRVYAARSRKQYWSGWNLTLNNWFRDYFLFPLTKNATKQWQINIALLTTFVLIGLWHGFEISLIIWGFLNGLWILVEKYLNLSSKPIGLIYHLLFASSIALVFRSHNLKETFFSVIDISPILDNEIVISKGIIISFLFMDLVYRAAKNKRIDEYIGEQKTHIRWLFYLIIVGFILLFGVNFKNNDFYYFQF